MPVTNNSAPSYIHAGQAVRVSVQMMHAKNLFILMQEQILQSMQDEGRPEGQLDEISR
jgi:hypothetical protein